MYAHTALHHSFTHHPSCEACTEHAVPFGIQSPRARSSRFRRFIAHYAAKLPKALKRKQLKPTSLLLSCAEPYNLPKSCDFERNKQFFIHRNVGNLVPPSVDAHRGSPSAALEATIHYAVAILGVEEVIVCGHSGCSAMQALLSGAHQNPASPLSSWLRFGGGSVKTLSRCGAPDSSLSPEDQLSQVNIIQQIQNLETYDDIQRSLDNGVLRVSGWYFDSSSGQILTYDPQDEIFKLLGQEDGANLVIV
jgi:carbonic anhydrase